MAIPVVLAAAGLWFPAQQDARQQRIETQRAQSEQEIEERRTQDAALQAYLDQMSSLMIGKNSLRNSEEDSEVHTLARARTLTVLGRLDPKRKTQVMQFLVQGTHGANPIIALSGADLSHANLSGAYLSEVGLVEANLEGVQGVTEEQLQKQARYLYRATMPNGQKYEDWLKSTGTADTTGNPTETTGAPRGTTTSGTTGGANGGTNTTGTSTTGGATNGGDTTSTNDGVMENGKSGGSSWLLRAFGGGPKAL